MLTLATEFTRRYPQQEFGHAQLAVALSGKSRLGEALTELDRAERLGLDEFEAHAMRADFYDSVGNTGKAIQEYTALTRHPEARPFGLLGRAGCLIELGDLDQALRDANEAVATLPDEKGYFVRGNVHRLKGDLEKCLEDYGRAIRLCPNVPDLFECRAEVYELLGMPDEANADRVDAASAAAVADQLDAGPVGPQIRRLALRLLLWMTRLCEMSLSPS